MYRPQDLQFVQDAIQTLIDAPDDELTTGAYWRKSEGDPTQLKHCLVGRMIGLTPDDEVRKARISIREYGTVSALEKVREFHAKYEAHFEPFGCESDCGANLESWEFCSTVISLFDYWFPTFGKQSTIGELSNLQTRIENALSAKPKGANADLL